MLKSILIVKYILLNIEFLRNVYKIIFFLKKNLNLSIIYINIATLLVLVYRYWKIYLIQVRKAQVNNEIILRSIISFSLS